MTEGTFTLEQLQDVNKCRFCKDYIISSRRLLRHVNETDKYSDFGDIVFIVIFRLSKMSYRVRNNDNGILWMINTKNRFLFFEWAILELAIKLNLNYEIRKIEEGLNEIILNKWKSRVYIVVRKD